MLHNFGLAEACLAAVSEVYEHFVRSASVVSRRLETLRSLRRIAVNADFDVLS